jgi:hypothetical protein
MNDFATEEFLQKNIRVRPISGMTRGDDDGRTNDQNKSIQDQQDPDEKIEKDIRLDIEEDRNEIKER